MTTKDPILSQTCPKSRAIKDDRLSRSTAEILQRYKEVLRRLQDLENAIRQHRREWTKAEIKHPRDVALWNTLGDEK